MIELKADNFNLVGENKRLIFNKQRTRMIKNPDYTNSQVIMFFCFKNCLCIRDRMLEGDVTIELEVWTYKDIDNIIKPIFDVLEQLKIIKNDRDIVQVYATKHKIKRGQLDKVKIRIYEISKDII